MRAFRRRCPGRHRPRRWPDAVGRSGDRTRRARSVGRTWPMSGKSTGRARARRRPGTGALGAFLSARGVLPGSDLQVSGSFLVLRQRAYLSRNARIRPAHRWFTALDQTHEERRSKTAELDEYFPHRPQDDRLWTIGAACRGAARPPPSPPGQTARICGDLDGRGIPCGCSGLISGGGRPVGTHDGWSCPSRRRGSVSRSAGSPDLAAFEPPTRNGRAFILMAWNELTTWSRFVSNKMLTGEAWEWA